MADVFTRRRTEEVLDAMLSSARAKFGTSLNDTESGILYQFFAIVAEQIATTEEAAEIGYLAFDANAVEGTLQDRLYALNGIVRQEGESDADFRNRRGTTLEAAGNGTVEAIQAAIVNDVADVSQAIVYENKESTTSPDGISPYAILAVVLDGDSDEIAQKIFEEVCAGTPTDGDITIPVIDSQGISHDISFSRPGDVNIYIEVNITVDSDFPVGGAVSIRDALVAYGGDLEIGQDVVYSRLFTPINSVPGHQVDSLYVDIVDPPAGTANITIAVDEIARIAGERITVNVT